MKPYIVYMIGVAGSGKTTIGYKLSVATGIPFFDADDFHPPANKKKMKAGKALNDGDRKEWLTSIHKLAKEHSQKKGAIIACSALKEKYRILLSEEIKVAVYWILLQGSFELIHERMKARKDHFMPVGLLQSQFDTLETPGNAIVVDIKNNPEEIVAEIIRQVKLIAG